MPVVHGMEALVLSGEGVVIHLGCAYCDYKTFRATLEECRANLAQHRAASGCGQKQAVRTRPLVGAS